MVMVFKVMKRKNRAQIKIHQYKERRGIHKTRIKEITKRERAVIKNLSYKIKQWSREIRRLEKDEAATNQVIWLGNTICLFMGRNVKQCGRVKDKQMMQAKGIFFKYGMEHGLRGEMLREYTGIRDHNAATRIRMTFTRSFAKSRENKELYYRFKEFVNREPEDSN